MVICFFSGDMLEIGLVWHCKVWFGLTGGLLARLVMRFVSGAILKIVWYGVLRFGLDLPEAAWRGWSYVSFPGAILETWFGMAW